jgi:hypothetical protein
MFLTRFLQAGCRSFHRGRPSLPRLRFVCGNLPRQGDPADWVKAEADKPKGADKSKGIGSRRHRRDDLPGVAETLLAPDRYSFQVLSGNSQGTVFRLIETLQQAGHLARKLLLRCRIQRIECGEEWAIVRGKVFHPVRGGAIAEDEVPFGRLERGDAITKEVA